VSLFVVTVIIGESNIDFLYSTLLLFSLTIAIYYNIKNSEELSFLKSSYLYVAPINFSFMTIKMMYNTINSKEAFINKTELQRLHKEHKAVLQKIPDGAMIYQSHLDS
jgi:hypothetical protein